MMMTEHEWLSSADPTPMLWFVRDTAPSEGLRQFACACCRRIWHLLSDGRSRRAVEVAERYARGEVEIASMNDASFQAEEAESEVDYAAYVAEAEANFCLTERYSVILARRYAAIAAAQAAVDDPRWGLRRGEHGSHGWAAAARKYAAMACVFEYLGDRAGSLPEFIANAATSADDAERRAQAELLREILDYPE